VRRLLDEGRFHITLTGYGIAVLRFDPPAEDDGVDG
jgi:hypothetical protein